MVLCRYTGRHVTYTTALPLLLLLPDYPPRLYDSARLAFCVTPMMSNSPRPHTRSTASALGSASRVFRWTSHIRPSHDIVEKDDCIKTLSHLFFLHMAPHRLRQERCAFRSLRSSAAKPAPLPGYAGRQPNQYRGHPSFSSLMLPS